MPGPTRDPGGQSVPRGAASRTGSPLPPAPVLARPLGEGGGLFWRSGKESWTKSAAASSALTGWSRPERSSQSLAQVSPAAAPVLAEEVCKEWASKQKPESETPPAALAAVCTAQHWGRWGAGARPAVPGRSERPLPWLLRGGHVRGWGRAREVLTRAAVSGGGGCRCGRAGGARAGCRSPAAPAAPEPRSPLPALRPRARPTLAPSSAAENPSGGGSLPCGRGKIRGWPPGISKRPAEAAPRVPPPEPGPSGHRLPLCLSPQSARTSAR